jgi:hypothetical protein
MFCSAYVSATKSAYPPPFDSIKNPTNIVDKIEPNMINIPPAKTVRNSLSGILAMSESMVEINIDDMDDDIDEIDAYDGSITREGNSRSGHSRFRDVLSSLVVGIVNVRDGRRCVLPKDDVMADDAIVVGANDATRLHDDAMVSVANSAAAEGGVDLFFIDKNERMPSWLIL